jgi:succinate dehydrogenase/fumarate reductase-like Fe-S protein
MPDKPNQRFFVDKTGYVSNLNKELCGKDKLITECTTIQRCSELTFDCGKNQLKVHNLFNFPHIKHLIFYIVTVSMNMSSTASIFVLLREQFDQQSKASNL